MQLAGCGPSAAVPCHVGEWITILAALLTFPMGVLIAVQAYIMYRKTRLMFAQAGISNKMAMRDGERHRSSSAD